ncbi:MAG: hypothetical protein QOI47_39, partial [Actinomycetota bacterium]|nr:hypothetical protein [Actinomycetota bacterium]
AYGLLYASFGFGAVIGAISSGTFLANVPRPKVVVRGMLGFSLALGTFAVLRHPLPAYPTVALLGFAYFATVTAMTTILQVHLDDAVRGRVMSLWLMAFGGTVPLGLMIGGPIAQATSITLVLLYGSIAAFVLFLWMRVALR